MKKIFFPSLVVLCATLLFAFGKKPGPSQAGFFTGSWTYRSLINAPMNTPFADLEFATAVMRFQRTAGDSIFGILDMGPGWALNLKGKTTTCNGSTTFYIQGDGVPNTNTANWQYNYQGYIVPKWRNGVGQVETCVGSVIRAKPHGNAKAGMTASFYMTRQ